MLSWARHSGDSKWHLGEVAGGSFVTRCRGRWPTTDESVEYSAPLSCIERCEACLRSRVEAGLAELVRNAPADYDWPGQFELGGEG